MTNRRQNKPKSDLERDLEKYVGVPPTAQPEQISQLLVALLQQASYVNSKNIVISSYPAFNSET